MAWIDDRIWCHPKLAGLSSHVAWTYVKSIAYSSGFETHGVLNQGQLNTIRCDSAARKSLVAAGLWHALEDGISIHDWDDHNGSRDARKQADRERKRRQRERERSRGQSRDSHADNDRDAAVTSRGKSTVTAHVDRVTSEEEPRAVTSKDHAARDTATPPADDPEPEQPEEYTIEDWNGYHAIAKEIP